MNEKKKNLQRTRGGGGGGGEIYFSPAELALIRDRGRATADRGGSAGTLISGRRD